MKLSNVSIKKLFKGVCYFEERDGFLFAYHYTKEQIDYFRFGRAESTTCCRAPIELYSKSCLDSCVSFVYSLIYDIGTCFTGCFIFLNTVAVKYAYSCAVIVKIGREIVGGGCAGSVPFANTVPISASDIGVLCITAGYCSAEKYGYSEKKRDFFDHFNFITS